MFPVERTQCHYIGLSKRLNLSLVQSLDVAANLQKTQKTEKQAE